MLHRAWSYEIGDDDFSTASNKLTAIVNSARTHIKEVFLLENQREMSADDTFSLVAAMLIAEQVKSKSPVVYSRLLDHLDTCMTADAVASKAAFYSDRMADSGQERSFYADMEKQINQLKSQMGKMESKKGGSSDKKKAKNTKADNRTPEQRELIKACLKAKVCIKWNLGEKCSKSPCPYPHHFPEPEASSNFAKVDPVTLFKSDFQ